MKQSLLVILMIVGIPTIMVFLWVGFDGPRRGRIARADGFGVIAPQRTKPVWRWEHFTGETEWYRQNKAMHEGE